MTTRAVLPVKAFSRAKGRLAAVRTPGERARLAELMATATLAAVARFDPIVPCDDPAVARWATTRGAVAVDAPDGLDAAIGAGLVAAAGADLAAICHADLAFPDGLTEVLARGCPCIVADRHADGTNILVIPPGAGFVVSYGPGSFRRHLAEADRVGIELTVVDHLRLGWDVDDPDDLETPADWGPPSWER